MSDIIRDANLRESILNRAAKLGITGEQLEQVKRATLTANHMVLAEIDQTEDDERFKSATLELGELPSAA